MALQKTFSFFKLIPQTFYVSCRGKKWRTYKNRNNYKFKEFKLNHYPDEPCIEKYGMKYYPRTADYVDPPCEPSKLFMVQRVKPVKGNPHWDVKVLAEFGLDGLDNKRVVVVKNIPTLNQKLWRIKHLVKITPVNFPNGEPTESDIERTWLTHDGQMIVSDAVRTDPRRIEAREEFKKKDDFLDGKTLRDESRRRWLSAW